MFTRLRSFLRRRRTLRVPTRRPLDRFMFFASYALRLADVHLPSNSATCLPHISTATDTRGKLPEKTTEKPHFQRRISPSIGVNVAYIKPHHVALGFDQGREAWLSSSAVAVHSFLDIGARFTSECKLDF